MTGDDRRRIRRDPANPRPEYGPGKDRFAATDIGDNGFAHRPSGGARKRHQQNEFVFVEEWEDGDALERHFATPHIGEFMGAIPATIVAPPDVKFHTIASTMDLADVSTA